MSDVDAEDALASALALLCGPGDDASRRNAPAVLSRPAVAAAVASPPPPSITSEASPYGEIFTAEELGALLAGDSEADAAHAAARRAALAASVLAAAQAWHAARPAVPCELLLLPSFAPPATTLVPLSSWGYGDGHFLEDDAAGRAIKAAVASAPPPHAEVTAAPARGPTSGAAFIRGSATAKPFAPGGESVAAARVAGPGAAVAAAAASAAARGWVEAVNRYFALGSPLPWVDVPGHPEGPLFCDPAVAAAATGARPAGPSPAIAIAESDPGATFESMFGASTWAEEEEENSGPAGGGGEPLAAVGGWGDDEPKPGLESINGLESGLESTPESGDAAPVDRVLAATAASAASPLADLRLCAAAAAAARAAPPPVTWAVQSPIPGLDDDAVFDRLAPSPALRYSFRLDAFQREAIVRLERGESVFVAAHTSAGKTAVAEYAFALAARHCTRAVYTSPIKTISNQKYRDFTRRGFDVGLLTGDVALRPEAPGLIMTTEILRSMLYRGADVVRDIEWVVFDEVHYVNDAERGVVWEEVIIMLPAHVGLVMLSATVPNVMDFAGWVGRTKRKVIHVMGTTKRPVPLEHVLCYNNEMYTVCDEVAGFQQAGHRAAMAAYRTKTAGPAPKPGAVGPGAAAPGAAPLAASGGKPSAAQQQQMRHRQQVAREQGLQRAVSAGTRPGGGANAGGQRWQPVLALLGKRGLLPAVVFAFSKKKCDESADSLRGADLTAGTGDKATVATFLARAFGRLKGSDRELPQIGRVSDLLKRGIGVHHAGLLPIVKEVVEFLFCRGLLRVLFSTETFAMGVNAPARAVVFHGLRKHDGREFRTLLPGEYTQMAGRAGRRGLDTVGTVLIMCWDEVPEEAPLRSLLTGKATKLESQFRLRFSMILNLLRGEDLRVEDMLKRSFAEFHAQRALPAARQQLAAAVAAYRALPAEPPCPLYGTHPDLGEYSAKALQSESLTAQIQAATATHRGVQAALGPGRVILACLKSGDPPVPAAIVRVGPADAPGGRLYCVIALRRGEPPEGSLLVGEPGSGPAGAAAAGGKKKKTSLFGDDDDDGIASAYSVRGKAGAGAAVTGGGGLMPQSLPWHGAGPPPYSLAAIPPGSIAALCKAKIKVDAAAMLESQRPETLCAAADALSRAVATGGGDQHLDPLTDLQLGSDMNIVAAYEARRRLQRDLAACACHGCPRLGDHLDAARQRAALAATARRLHHAASDAALAQLPDYHQRVAVLCSLGYLDSSQAVQLKGRVACEVNTGDELVTTELVLAGVLGGLSPAEAIALLSALVFQDKTDCTPELSPALAAACDHVSALARGVAREMAAAGLPVTEDDFLKSSLNFGLVEAVHAWASGVDFVDVCALTDVPEGSIVRTVMRLDETAREVRNAARVVGNAPLFQQMVAASELIKRDVISAASLYITGPPE